MYCGESLNKGLQAQYNNEPTAMNANEIAFAVARILPLLSGFGSNCMSDWIGTAYIPAKKPIRIRLVSINAYDTGKMPATNKLADIRTAPTLESFILIPLRDTNPENKDPRPTETPIAASKYDTF